MERKVAIIHDWLNGMRGGEKVLEEMLELLPGADIYTLFLEEENISDKIRSHRIIASPLNKYSFIRKRYKHFLPLFPAAIESFNLTGYDLIISISHCVAKGIIPGPDTTHISYVNSPMRYIWDQYYSYFGKAKGIKKFFIQRQISKLKLWDVTSSSRVDYFIGNSNFVKKRIWKYYRREASVIHPPVDTDFYQPADNPKRDYFLTVSALVPYKEIGLLIEAFNRSGDRLIIVGKGPEERKLKQRAGKNIIFKKNLPGEELKELYQHAAAFVFAGVEDFGIVFVEAQACGTPVLAYKKGGVLDIVTEDTGILFEQQTPEHIINAINKIKKMALKPLIIRKNSIKFSKESFKKNFKDYMNDRL
ncbi:MAG: glycosyltransferase [Candidatus Aminicenantes bacterium]|nr:MAG: glycosyltransferase [Candidatus Aminicenantes bacterium]